MHDLYEAKRILDLVLKEAKKNNFSKVKKIVLELGEIKEHGEEINSSNLEFNLKMLARGTLAEGFKIEIKRIKKPFWVLKEIIGE